MKSENRYILNKTFQNISCTFYLSKISKSLNPNQDITSIACATISSCTVDPLFYMAGYFFEDTTVTVWDKSFDFANLKQAFPIRWTSDSETETSDFITLAKAFTGAIIAGALASYVAKGNMKQCLLEYGLTFGQLQTIPHVWFTRYTLQNRSPSKETPDLSPIYPYLLTYLVTTVGSLYLKMNRYPSVPPAFFLIRHGLALSPLLLLPLYETISKDEGTKALLSGAVPLGALLILMNIPIKTWKNIPTSYYKWDMTSVVTSTALALIFFSKHSPLYE